jgi:hypothetical protein
MNVRLLKKKRPTSWFRGDFLKYVSFIMGIIQKKIEAAVSVFGAKRGMVDEVLIDLISYGNP